jgi:hypothetical protein
MGIQKSQGVQQTKQQANLVKAENRPSSRSQTPDCVTEMQRGSPAEYKGAP